jgi:hypothetical protein
MLVEDITGLVGLIRTALLNDRTDFVDIIGLH